MCRTVINFMIFLISASSPTKMELLTICFVYFKYHVYCDQLHLGGKLEIKIHHQYFLVPGDLFSCYNVQYKSYHHDLQWRGRVIYKF